MKYYTNIVPTYAYSKLLEKGMPVNLVTYAEVFDWLMTNGVYIYIFPDKGGINEDDIWRYSCDVDILPPLKRVGFLDTSV